MNPQILQKCVAELKKDNPSLEYVVGILETLIEIGGGQSTSGMTYDAKIIQVPHVGPYIGSDPLLRSSTTIVAEEVSDEQAVLAEKYAKGPVAPTA